MHLSMLSCPINIRHESYRRKCWVGLGHGSNFAEHITKNALNELKFLASL